MPISAISQGQKIAIVGGGMVGAVTALLLSRYLPHATIQLFDRLAGGSTQNDEQAPSARPSFDGRSTAIAPTTQRCFKQLGLWSQLLPHATPIHNIHISDKGHAGQGLFDRCDNAGEPLGYVVQNAGLGPVLMRALRQANRLKTHECEVTAVNICASGALLTLSDHSTYCADLVIIADGADSQLRGQLGITARVDDYQQHAIVANVRHTQAHELTAYERFTARGPMALLPLGGHANAVESTLVWTCPSAHWHHYQTMSPADRLVQLQRQFGFRLGHFSAMSDPAFYPLRRVLADEQVRQHVVLMGNAAHFLHPVAGQGFNLSVRDALRLTAVLKASAEQGQYLGSLDVLGQYEREQAADQYYTVGLSHSFHRLFTGAPLPVQLGRTLGFLALELNPMIRTHFIGLLSGQAVPQATL
ncbi:FAD-dependent monooxygenase [Marinagarivorans algicola]|uniref:FAD-dependent monooxygenase n=1 Tax=Marinagarivorans algicola TaxID=1513270 RepID=UPI0006B536A5|nr:FAD-dependent monooxygenase [Marinagarivorans algicola]